MEGKEKFSKWFRRDNLIIVVLAGVLLFIIALPTKEDTGQQAGTTAREMNFLQEDSGNAEKGNAGIDNVEENMSKEYDYAVYLEQKLKKTLAGVNGVGKVEVMITLQASEELVVEKDAPVSRSNTNEADSEGGSRVVSQMETQETTIYRTEGDSAEPYVIKTILPQVEGVLVVAQGAGSGSVSKNITEIVQALFGVEAHKVKVVEMDDDT